MELPTPALSLFGAWRFKNLSPGVSLPERRPVANVVAMIDVAILRAVAVVDVVADVAMVADMDPVAVRAVIVVVDADLKGNTSLLARGAVATTNLPALSVGVFKVLVLVLGLLLPPLLGLLLLLVAVVTVMVLPDAAVLKVAVVVVVAVAVDVKVVDVKVVVLRGLLLVLPKFRISARINAATVTNAAKENNTVVKNSVVPMALNNTAEKNNAVATIKGIVKESNTAVVKVISIAMATDNNMNSLLPMLARLTMPTTARTVRVRMLIGWMISRLEMEPSAIRTICPKAALLLRLTCLWKMIRSLR